MFPFFSPHFSLPSFCGVLLSSVISLLLLHETLHLTPIRTEGVKFNKKNNIVPLPCHDFVHQLVKFSWCEITIGESAAQATARVWRDGEERRIPSWLTLLSGEKEDFRGVGGGCNFRPPLLGSVGPKRVKWSGKY